MNGVLVVNKPKDFTSFDVVAVVRKYIKQKKIGHTGTLDPMATGVLPLLLGSTAKAQQLMPDSTKAYMAEFLLGTVTDTLDITGTVQSVQEVSVTPEELKAALGSYRGEIMQLPPMYSAVSVNGKRLYELARNGIEVERELRKVTIEKLELLDFSEKTKTGKIYVECTKGTYIRSLIDDIGKDLGCGAVLTALNRTKACGYTLNDAVTLEEVKELCDEGRLEEKLLPTESIFSIYPQVMVTKAQAVRFSNGGALDINRTSLKGSKTDGQIIRVKDLNGEFLGLGITDSAEESLKIYKLFA